MPIHIVVAKAHEDQLQDYSIHKELDSIQKEVNTKELAFQPNSIGLVFVKGIYDDSLKKMITALLLANKLEKPIRELHAELRIAFRDRDAIAAKATLNFDEAFMGVLQQDDALLIHLGIPVKGLDENYTFTANDVNLSLNDVRVSYMEDTRNED